MLSRWLSHNSRVAILLVVIVSPMTWSASETTDPFEALDRQLEAQFRDTDATLEENFQALDAALEAGFQRLSDEVGAVWGEDNIEMPSQNVWVDYSENRRLRRKFDFERGLLIVERIVDDTEDSALVADEIKAAVAQARTDTPQDLAEKDSALQYAKAILDDAGVVLEQPAEDDSSEILGDLLMISSSEVDLLDERLKAADEIAQPITLPNSSATLPIEKTFLTKGQETTPQPVEASQSAATETAVLSVIADGGEVGEQPLEIDAGVASEVTAVASEEDVPMMSEAASEANGVSDLRSSVVSGVGDPPAEFASAQNNDVVTTVRRLQNDQKKVQVTIPFRQDYLSERARQYTGAVDAEASRRQLPPSLVYAVIETESHFNPRARSHVPAFGLMQLVPKSGGLDAYHYVYGEKKVLAPEYFFQPTQNVELGVAYLDLLYRRYLRAIEDDQSRLYCTIAAYNTGAGNVARAFTDASSVRAASKVINGMSSDEVYAHLLENLPYDETRNYLRKVTSAQARYAHRDDSI